MMFLLLSLLLTVGEANFNILPVVPFPQEAEMISTVRRSLHVEEFKITTDKLREDKVISSTISRYERYFERFERGPASPDGYVTEVSVTVADPTAQLKIGVDESYTLNINPLSPVVKLAAKTRFGVVRGLETFYQLYNITDGTFPSVKIKDYPRFTYRGFLIDTSRHFLPVDTIEKVITGLAMSKFNVLHWHIVDDPSFPYYSPTFPSLAEEGAYDMNHVYRISDILQVISYAEDHGIVVVPEFDTPGHTLSWGKGLENFLTHCPGVGTFGGDYGPINPSVEANYQVLQKLLAEVTSLFPSGFIHLGGDEVPFNCWAANQELVAWMKKQGIQNFNDLESYYEERLLDIVHHLNTSYVVWEEIFNNNLQIQPDTIIHVWKDKWQATMGKVIKAGYKTILSSPWYLNYISFSRDWKTYYQVEPLKIPGATAEELNLVIGGEACMWGEYVDATNILSRTFPRASAVAERLWSSEKRTNVADMEFRLDKHRCGMCARDIPAETIILRSYCPVEFSGYDHW